MKRIYIKKLAVILGLIGVLAAGTVYGAPQNSMTEIDNIRAQLACQKDSSSSEYQKLRTKLDKLIKQNKYDYSQANRYNDALRLISEKKYNPAIYELKALIAENFNRTKCFELLGDVCIKSEQNYSKGVKYYKTALKENQNNISAAYKLAKVYLKQKKNILGLEYLKYTVERTQNPDVLAEIEYIIKNKIQPEDKYDANNMYETLGNIYVRLNRKDDAFNAFNMALRLNPDDLYLKYRLADLYYQVGQDENASVVYDDILNENPNDLGIRTSMAKTYYREGNMAGAELEYRKLLAKNPDSVQGLYGLYKIYSKNLPADKILEKIYCNDPNFKAGKEQALSFARIMQKTNDASAVNTFVSYAKELDRIEKEKLEAKKRAAEEKQKAAQQEKLKLQKIEQEKQLKIKQEQERIKQQKELQLKKKAEAEALRQKKIQQQQEAIAKAKEEKIRKEQLAVAEAKRLQEERLLKEKEQREEAKRRQEEKIRQENERKQALLKQQEEKRLEQQRILAEKKAMEERLAQEKKEKAEQLRQQKLLEAEKQKELARKKAEELALKKQREAEDAAKKKANEEKLLAERKQKEYEDKLIEAEKQKAKQKDINAYNKTMETIKNYSAQKPLTAQTYIAIANTYKMNNQTMSAIRNYKEAMKLDPTNSDIYYNLGLSYLELNSLVTSKANLTKAVNLNRDNTKALNLLGFVNQKMVTGIINDAFSKFEKKDYMSAYDILDKGIKDFPNNSQLYYYRALVADAMNRNSAQIMDLQKSIELDASNYMSFYQLGKAYEKINDERNALVAYERFLSTEPDEKELVSEIQQKVIKLGEKYY